MGDDRSDDGSGIAADPAGPEQWKALRFQPTRHPTGAVVVHAIGEIDSETSPELWVELGVWSEQSTDIVLDLSQVSFLGSAGLSTLLAARNMIADGGGRMSVRCGASRAVRRSLQVTGTMEVLDVVDRLPEPTAPGIGHLFPVPDPD